MTLEASENAPEAEEGSTPADAEATPAEELVSTQADASETEDEPESNKTTSSGDQAEGKPDKLQALIDSKYGGDRQKFTDALYEQWNSSSQLRSEIKELKSYIQEIKEQTAAPQPPEPPINDANYKALDESIGALDQELAATETLRQELIKGFNKLDAQINRLTGQWDAADDFNKVRLEQKIGELKAEQRDLDKEWKASLRDDKATQREKKALQAELKQLEKVLAEDRAKQKQSLEEDLEYQASFRAAFDGAVADAATARGIAEGSKIREHLLATIKAEAIVYLQQVNPELPDDFVKQRTDAYFEVQGLAKKANFSTQSKPQPLMQKPSAGTSKSSSQSPSGGLVPKKGMTAEQARAFISKKSAELDARFSRK